MELVPLQPRRVVKPRCEVSSALSSSELAFLLNELCSLQPLPAAPFSLESPAAHLGGGPAQERRHDQTVVSSTRTGRESPAGEALNLGPRPALVRQGRGQDS